MRYFMTDLEGIGPHLRFMNINKINIPSVNKHVFTELVLCDIGS